MLMMMNPHLDACWFDYSRFNKIDKPEFINMLDLLAIEANVQAQWIELKQLGFIRWAASVGGLKLGIPTAKRLWHMLYVKAEHNLISYC